MIWNELLKLTIQQVADLERNDIDLVQNRHRPGTSSESTGVMIWNEPDIDLVRYLKEAAYV